MDYNYNGYDRGYTEPAMTSADYMNRTYRWMAVGPVSYTHLTLPTKLEV